MRYVNYRYDYNIYEKNMSFKGIYVNKFKYTEMSFNYILGINKNALNIRRWGWGKGNEEIDICISFN